MYYIYTYIPATCLSSIMICFGASTLQKKALNNQNTGQNWVPGIYIYIYKPWGCCHIFSIHVAFCPILLWKQNTNQFQGSQLDFPPGSACGPSETNSNRWMLENLELLKDDGILNFMAAMKLWSLCNWKEKLNLPIYLYRCVKEIWSPNSTETMVMVSSDGTKITKSQKETNPRNMCQEFVFAKKLWGTKSWQKTSIRSFGC